MLPAKVTGLRHFPIEKGCTEEISGIISRNNSFIQTCEGTKAQGRGYPRCSAALSVVQIVMKRNSHFTFHAFLHATTLDTAALYYCQASSAQTGYSSVCHKKNPHQNH